MGEHRAILDAALARDADAAVGLVTEHIQRTTEILLQDFDDADVGLVDADLE